MSVQVTASHRSPSNVLKRFNSHPPRPSTLCISPPDLLILLRKKPLKLTAGRPVYRRRTIPPKTYPRLPFGVSRSYQRCSPVCSFGGEGKPESGNEASPWNSLEKAMGSLKKEQSVEDALRQQIEKQEYYDDGDSGGNGLGGGDGGGKGRGRGSSPGGSGDEGFLDELLQTTLAIMGIIFLYAYFIQGDNYWFILTRDYIKYLFGARKSNRLQLAKIWWRKVCRKWMPTLVVKPYHLETDVVNTPTYWDDIPNKYHGFSIPGTLPLPEADILDSDRDRLDSARMEATGNYWYYSEDEYQESEKDDDDDDDEPSLSSGKGDESFLKYGEADEPYLASEEENEPDLTSNVEESNLKSIDIVGSVPASGENGVLNLGSTESESEDEGYSDSTDSDDDYFSYTGKVKFNQGDEDFATRVVAKEKRVRYLGRTKKVKRRVRVSRECEEDDEDEDTSTDDDEESDYVGNDEDEDISMKDEKHGDNVGNEEEDDEDEDVGAEADEDEDIGSEDDEDSDFVGDEAVNG